MGCGVVVTELYGKNYDNALIGTCAQGFVFLPWIECAMLIFLLVNYMPMSSRRNLQ